MTFAYCIPVVGPSFACCQDQGLVDLKAIETELINKIAALSLPEAKAKLIKTLLTKNGIH